MSKQQLPILDLSVDQVHFLEVTTFELLGKLKVDDQPLWGMMTPQHMVEHLIFIQENSLGIREVAQITPEDKLPKFQAFLRSNYGFSRNFKFAILPENNLLDLRYESLEEAIVQLKEITNQLLVYINQNEFEYTDHPYYGQLDKNDTILFQFKHNMHHLMQFDLV